MTIGKLIHAAGWDAMECYYVFVDVYDQEISKKGQEKVYNEFRFLIDMSYKFEFGKWY